MFQHPIKHRTTWQAPTTPNRNHKSGEPRRNPVRNRIDYIIMRRRDMNKVSDSRPYSGMQIHSVHRLVLATVRETLPPPRCKINAIRIDKKPTLLGTL